MEEEIKNKIDRSVRLKLELEDMMLNNFTGEHNSWDEVIELLNKFEESLEWKKK